jgi:hypothetical protein
MQVMDKVPRHAFVPIELQPYAYANSPLPIGFDKTISQYGEQFFQQFFQRHHGEQQRHNRHKCRGHESDDGVPRSHTRHE